MSATPHRAGVAALLGPPNVGKSSLLNRLVGERLAIVSAKPQTTRSRILGIVSRPEAQIVLVDTPGLHGARRPLNRALNAAAEEAAQDCDVALLLVDTTRGLEPAHTALWARARARGIPLLGVGTRSDLGTSRDWPPELATEGPWLRVSARTGEGLDGLAERIARLLPEGPALYDPDQLTDRPLRFLAAELVREAVFEELEQELPYSVAVEIEAFDESRPERTEIRARLLVERDSQKRIVVGSGGAQIKRIGVRARAQIEALLGRRVHLGLWVGVEPGWPKSRRRLEALGYR